MPGLYPYQNKMYHKFSDNLNNWIPGCGSLYYVGGALVVYPIIL